MNEPISPKPPASACEMMQEQHQWQKKGWPLVVLNLGLLATSTVLYWLHPSFLRAENWHGLALCWLGGLIISAGLGLLIGKLRRPSILHSARALDESLGAKNRLEMAVALSSATDPIALAQREETDGFVKTVRVYRRNIHLRLLAGLLAVILVSQLLFLVVWIRPWHLFASPAQAYPLANLPKASIVLQSPAAEIKAAPIEEVRISAVAESETGLKDMSLEVSVNGEPRPPVPVVKPELQKPGNHQIQIALELDQLDLKPYDMVAYYVNAQRVFRKPIPATVSAVQFIEIKPFREDVHQAMGGGSKNELISLITALKVVQLRLLKENFVLEHAEIGHDSPVWGRQNTRVADEQSLLEKKTAEVIAKMVQAGESTELVDFLEKARAFMPEASEQIKRLKNQSAIPLQGKALAQITEVEKFFFKEKSDGSKQPPPPMVKDPFEIPKPMELTKREETPAGELERLAQEQSRLAEEIGRQKNSPQEDADPGKQSLKDREAKISQKLAGLLEKQTFGSDVLENLTNGQHDLQNALKQLEAEDIPMALEPAAQAATQLRRANEAMNKAGNEKAADQIAEALRQLAQASAQAQTAPQQSSASEAQAAVKSAANQMAKTQNELSESARQQQESGSGKAAARLASAARKLGDPNLRKDFKELYDHPLEKARAETVSQQITQIAGSIAAEKSKPTPEEIESLIRRMEQSLSNLEHLSAGAERTDNSQSREGKESNQGKQAGRGEGKEGAKGQGAEEQRKQFAKEVVADLLHESSEAQMALPASPQLAEVKERLKSVGSSAFDVRVTFNTVQDPMAKLIALLKSALPDSKREYRLTDQNRAQAPSAYREAVADYFELLSKDFETVKPAGGAPAETGSHAP